MANYPAFNYQPQIGGYGQQMPFYQQAQQDQSLFCRPATNYQEVQAYPVDFSGRPMTFHGPGLQKIWVKMFDPNTGGSAVVEYHRAPAVIEEQPKLNAPSMEDFQSLQQTVLALQDEFNKMRTSRRRTSREEANDEI